MLFNLTYKKGSSENSGSDTVQATGIIQGEGGEAAQWADTCHTSVRSHIKTVACLCSEVETGDSQWSFEASYADMQRLVTKGVCLKQGGRQGLTAKIVL